MHAPWTPENRFGDILRLMEISKSATAEPAIAVASNGMSLSVFRLQVFGEMIFYDGIST